MAKVMPTKYLLLPITENGQYLMKGLLWLTHISSVNTVTTVVYRVFAVSQKQSLIVMALNKLAGRIVSCSFKHRRKNLVFCIRKSL